MLLECCWQYREPPGASLLLTFCCSALSDFCSQISHQYLSLWGYFHILGGLKYQHTNRGKKRKKEPIPPLFHSPWNCSSVVLERKYWEMFFSTSFFSQVCNHDNAEEQLGGMMGWWGEGVWQLLRSRPFVSSVCSESWTVGVDLWWCNTAVCCLKRFFPMSAQLSHLTPDSTLPPPPFSNGLCAKKKVF